MRRTALLLTALAAVLATGCSTLVDDPAASVNGTEITVESLEDEVDQIEGNEDYKLALEQQYGATFGGASKGTFDSAFVAQLLSLRIYYELLEGVVGERGSEITEDERLEAREQTEQQLDSIKEGLLESFPEEYQDTLVHQTALLNEAQQLVVDDAPSAEEYFEERKDEFGEACVSHILVSTENREPAEARAEVEAIAARLAAGEDFAAVATAESDDPGSAPTGGDLQCGPRGRFVTEFEDAVFTQPVGQVGEPVETSFGYHLILVRSRTEPTLEEVLPEIEQRISSDTGQALSDFLIEVTCTEDADIEVNPRYGTWDRTPCDDLLGFPSVQPPERPTTTTAPLPEGEVPAETFPEG